MRTRNIIILFAILGLLYYFMVMKKSNEGRGDGTAVCCDDQMLNYDPDGMTNPDKYCDQTICESTQQPDPSGRTFNNIY